MQCVQCNSTTFITSRKGDIGDSKVCEHCQTSDPYNPGGLEEIINKYSFPVLAVDKKGQVMAANNTILNFLETTRDEIYDVLTGNIIHCKNSDISKRCDETAYCDGCTIRNSIFNTFTTKKPIIDVRTYKAVQKLDGSTEMVSMSITTEYIGNIVFVRFNNSYEDFLL